MYSLMLNSKIVEHNATYVVGCGLSRNAKGSKSFPAKACSVSDFRGWILYLCKRGQKK